MMDAVNSILIVLYSHRLNSLEKAKKTVNGHNHLWADFLSQQHHPFGDDVVS